jgi:dihydrofolate reductase
MRKVILQEFVSLDGLAAGPNDSVDFIPASTAGDQSFARSQMAFIDSIDAMLLGRVTYEMFAGYWPNVTSGDDKPFADKLNAMPKIVFSRTLKKAPWGTWNNVRIVKNNPAKEVATLKQGSGKDMVVWGSISVAQSLMSERLVDEYQLVLCPLVLGSGKPLFRDKDSFDMKLLKTKSFDRGAVLLAYTATNHARPDDQE